MHAGTLPPSWLGAASTFGTELLGYLDLSDNRLSGSIPKPVFNTLQIAAQFKMGAKFFTAEMVLDPMKQPYGFCGPIPNDVHVLSAGGGDINGSMPAGPCPG